MRAMKSKKTRLAELVEHTGEKRKYGDYHAHLNKGSAPWRQLNNQAVFGAP
jgi:hypothetical protein